jgi:hypothetical protein
MFMKRVYPLVKRLYENLLAFFAVYDGNFFLGLVTGIIALSMVFYRFAGMKIGLPYSLEITMSPDGQFHLVSIDLFFSLMFIAYMITGYEKNNGKRVLTCLLLPVLIFGLHDMAWLIETFWVPQIYAGGVVISNTSLEEYTYHFMKNLVTAIPLTAYFLKTKTLRVNKLFLAAFSGMVLFHLIDIVFKINLYILNSSALLVMETIDAIPFLLLLKKR